MTGPQVVIVGGGIGGLCLAQGLHHAGVRVQVYERDPFPGSRWEGYRIHINPAGARALRACLGPRLWQAFLDTSGPGGDFGFLTDRLRELVVVEDAIMYPASASDPAESHYAVDRATLRRLLLAGLDDVVHFGAEFTGYELSGDGRVLAEFADGRSVGGDVLVGADGTSSRVRRQYLPQARQVRPGVGGVAHKVFLTDDTRGWIPNRLRAGMNMISHRGIALFTSVFQPPPGAREALDRVAGAHPEISLQPYLLGALVTDIGRLPPGFAQWDSPALRELVDRLLHGWHPTLRRLLADADPATRSALEFTASLPTPPWTTTQVTLLGDALHTMPATGGQGGNTALRDAHLLARQLRAVAEDRAPLLDALATYEQGLRRHGDAAVQTALRIKDQMLASSTIRSVVGHTWFRLCRAAPAVRRRTFGDWAADSRADLWEQEAVPWESTVRPPDGARATTKPVEPVE